MSARDSPAAISGETRLFAIVGYPIEQVRSPEAVTAELRRRGRDALLVPVEIAPVEFEPVTRAMMRVRNLDGLVFTVPFKAAARALADDIGPHARAVGAINALAVAATDRGSARCSTASAASRRCGGGG